MINLFKIIDKLPIGTKLHLKDDDIGVIHEVHGYELFADHTNIIFKDGTKLNMARLELIEELIND